MIEERVLAMMKQMVSPVLTSGVLIGLSLWLSRSIHSTFLDSSFFVGLMATVLLCYFSFTGDVKTRYMDPVFQGRTGLKTGKERDLQSYHFTPSIPFFTSLAYALLTLCALSI